MSFRALLGAALLVVLALSTTPPHARAATAAVRLVPASLLLPGGGAGAVTLEATAPDRGLGAWTVDVAYNPAVARPTACAPGPASACNLAYAPNRVRVSGATAPGPSGTVTLAAVTFTATGAPGAQTPLTVTVPAFSTSEGVAISPVVEHGQITIEGTSTGAVRLQPSLLSLTAGASAGVTVEANAPTAGLGGWAVDLVYDATLVTATACTPGSSSTCSTATPGRVRLTGAAAPPLSGSVTLAAVTLTALAPGGRSGPLTLTATTLVDGLGRTLQPSLTHGAVSVGAAAAATVQVTPSGSTIPAGGTASLTLTAAAPSPGIGAWVIDVDYPTGGLSLTGCVAAGGGVCNPRIGPGLARISGAAAAGLTGTPTLATLTFQALAAPGSVQAISPRVVALTDPAGAPVTASALPGWLTVTAQPVVQNLAPPSVTAGGAGFSLTVDGAGFQPGAAVRWNGDPRPTTFVSAARLTAQISAADIAAAGTVAITVLNPPPDATLSNSVNLPVTLPSLPAAPSGLAVTQSTPASVSLTWTDNATNETGYRVLRNGATVAALAAGSQSYVDSTSTCGTLYTYTVVATNLAGDSPASNAATVTPVCAPATPGNLRAGTRTRTTIPLLWDDLATGETAYQVSWSLVTPVNWTYVNLPGGSTAWTHTPVADGKEYVYAVRACTGATCSEWTASLAVTSLVPAAPTSLRLVQVTASAIAIGWNDASMYPTTLQVIWTPTSPPAYTTVDLPTGTLSWTHTGLAANQSYFYWVRACAGGQCSDLTGALTGTVAAALPPTGLQVASVTSSSVTLAWNTGAYRATSFQVIWTPAEAPSYTTVTVSNTSFGWTHTGLSPGRSYFYWVQACNGMGCSALAGAVSAVTAGGSAPAQPQRLRTGATADGIIVLLWDDVATTETSYQLVWATSGVSVYHTVNLAANSSVHIQTGVPVGENRHYWLRACISLLCSGLTGAVTTSAYAAPTPPTNPRAGTVTSTAIQMLWDDVATNETAYEVVWNPSGTSTFVTVPLAAGATAWTLTGASAGARYTFWVRACRGYVCSEYTASVSITAGLGGSAVQGDPFSHSSPADAEASRRGGASALIIAPSAIPLPVAAVTPPSRAVPSAAPVGDSVNPTAPGRLPPPRLVPLGLNTARVLPRPPADAPLPLAPSCSNARPGCP